MFAAAVIPETGEVEWVAYRVLPESIWYRFPAATVVEADRLLRGGQRDAALEQTPGFVQPDLSNAQDREYRTGEIRMAAEDRGRSTPMTSFVATPYWPELNQQQYVRFAPVHANRPWSGLIRRSMN